MIANARFFDDPYNTKNLRNIRNTDTWDYNCGGFALGTFSWYEPMSEVAGYDYRRDYLSACVSVLLEEFSDLRMIIDISDLHKDEYAIAFRASADDFHFLKRGDNGKWYHKRGSSPRIETIPTNEVFTTAWYDDYDSPIILFAKKKKVS